MKSADVHKRLIIQTAVAAGLPTAGMQLETRCITTVWSSVTPSIGMSETRFKGT